MHVICWLSKLLLSLREPLKLFVVFAFFVSACTSSKQNSATISLTFPKDPQSILKSKNFAQKLDAIDYAKLCFALNIVGTGITSVVRTCDIPKGIFAGSVAPGQNLSATVNSGSQISVQIYGLLKANVTDACPTGLTTGWNWPLERVYLLGETDNVTVQAPSTTVNVEISLPDSTQNLITQQNLPASCAVATSTGAIGNTGTGGGKMIGANYQVTARTGPVSEEKVLSGSKFKVISARTKGQP